MRDGDDEDDGRPGPRRRGLSRRPRDTGRAAHGASRGHGGGQLGSARQDRQVVGGRPQVGLGDPGQPGRHPAAEDLDALRGEDRVDALVRVAAGST